MTSEQKTELSKRYDEALALLKRCKKALQRTGWEEGESEHEVIDAINDVLSMEYLEQFIDGIPPLEVLFALQESVKLQSHYARILNDHDGGKRRQFSSIYEWIGRLKETGDIPVSV